MKDALKNDRARIQVGRISSFGLMEMSRQRLRTGVLEASTKACPHCEGTGLMRTASSSGLSALRIIEDEAARARGDRILLRAGREAAVYVLNKKRGELGEIEERYGVTVEVMIDEAFEGARMSVESSAHGPIPRIAPSRRRSSMTRTTMSTRSRSTRKTPRTAEENERPARREGGREAAAEGGDDEASRRKRRRRRGGRGRSRRDGEGGEQPARSGRPRRGRAGRASNGRARRRAAAADRRRGPPARTRRRRRGTPAFAPRASWWPRSPRPVRRRPACRGRRRCRSRAGGRCPAEEAAIAPVEAVAEAEPEADDKPKTRRRPRARKADAAAPAEVAAAEPVVPVAVAAEPAAEPEAAPAAPKRRSRAKKVVLPVDTDVAIELAVADASAAELVHERAFRRQAMPTPRTRTMAMARVRAVAGGSAPLAKGRVGCAGFARR